VNGAEKFPLVHAYFARVDPTNEFGVLVDEPCLPQHVRCGVLQLHKVKVKVKSINTFTISAIERQ
jgi:hypothetical protein